LLGSSTAQGYPYAPHANIGKITRLLVGDRIDGHRVRVMNGAGPGKTARVVRRDAGELVRKLQSPRNNLVFVYLGNNEFARLDRRHDLRRTERALFDEPVVSATERQRIAARYREDLENIFATLQRAGLQIVASRSAVNLADWQPNRSVLADPGHADSVRAWLAAAERQREPGAALRHFEGILALEPRFALASMRAGACCRALGRHAEARRHFQDAADNDGNPLREISELDAVLRQVAAEHRVPLLDAPRILAAASPDSLLGFELLWDNCHPNLEGYTLLAQGLVTMLDSLYDVTPQTFSLEAIRDSLGVDRDVERRVLNLEGQYCYVASTLTFDPGPRLARSRLYLERADALGPDADVVCSLAVLAALEGDVDRSMACWRKAKGLDAEVTRKRMDNRYVAQVMSRFGIEDVAKAAE
jgi:lysophospholipase L1-like esterase